MTGCGERDESHSIGGEEEGRRRGSSGGGGEGYLMPGRGRFGKLVPQGVFP
jgi:hypothetical protein